VASAGGDAMTAAQATYLRFSFSSIAGFLWMDFKGIFVEGMAASLLFVC
jgi:hypothetical protein